MSTVYSSLPTVSHSHILVCLYLSNIILTQSVKVLGYTTRDVAL